MVRALVRLPSFSQSQENELMTMVAAAEKAVERTISAASKLLEVTPASTTTNHRVNAANKYLRALFYSDSLEM